MPAHPRPRAGKTVLTAGERRSLVERLRADGARIAARFGLRYTAIQAEDARVRRRYGSCHTNGEIRIRLTHVRTGRPLKYSSMIDTLCHELAHLKFFHHGPRFRDFYEVILDWARREGIYRPTPRKSLRNAAQTAESVAADGRAVALVPALATPLAALDPEAGAARGATRAPGCSHPRPAKSKRRPPPQLELF